MIDNHNRFIHTLLNVMAIHECDTVAILVQTYTHTYSAATRVTAFRMLCQADAEKLANEIKLPQDNMVLLCLNMYCIITLYEEKTRIRLRKKGHLSLTLWYVALSACLSYDRLEFTNILTQ